MRISTLIVGLTCILSGCDSDDAGPCPVREAAGSQPQVAQTLPKAGQTVNSAAPVGEKLHTWSSIEYPMLKCPWAFGVATVDFRSSSTGIEFSLTFSGPGLADGKGWNNFVLPKGDKIIVRLHLRNGKIVGPIKGDSVFGNAIMFVGGGLGTSGTFHKTLPWQENTLDEAWVEVRFPGYVYWLEIPYGFVRNPKDKLCPPSKHGDPRFGKAMKKLDKNARIVNWKHVEYNIGTIQNGWQLSLLHANLFDANSELVLHTSRQPKDIFLSGLRTPRTSVVIKEADGFALKGRCMSIRLDNAGRSRSDKFKFNTSPGNNNRNWGKAIIKVRDKSYSVVMPSSMFRSGHGVSDPRHKQTLRSW